MTPIAHVIYLHGFASSPASSKAVRYGQELNRRQISYACPDLNQPAFKTLTVSRMLEQTRAAIAAAPSGPVALVGSSLGGFVAVHAAAADQGRRVDRLVLLAPALDFGGGRLQQFGEHSVADWRARGALRVFHYGLGAEQDIEIGLFDDAERYDAWSLDVAVPTLVYQGRQDGTVDAAMVAAWAATRAHVDLRLVDDGHQLGQSMDDIWRASAALFGLDLLGATDEART
jgi:pimeloyl-ACP methyl ester carboxylesterase